MNFHQVHIKYLHNGINAVLMVMTEGVANDVAVYRSLVSIEDLRDIHRASTDVAMKGSKLTQREAVQHFDIPLGKHYRV